MLTRLAGMDLSRVFDLDGSGFIDPIVLTRSLKIWDAGTFTDENVEDFLSWSKLERDLGHQGTASRIINIQDMISFVKAHCPKLRRLRRRSNSHASRSSGVTETETFSVPPRSFRSQEPSEPLLRGAERTPLQVPPVPPQAPAVETSRSKADSPELQKLVQRLAGLDILRVLDVDHTGYIDLEVLKSALNIFDKEIFTEEGIDMLMKAANLGDGPTVRILDLASFMGLPVIYPAPNATTSSSTNLGGAKHFAPLERTAMAAAEEGKAYDYDSDLIIPEPIPLTAAEELFWDTMDAQSDGGSTALDTARSDIEGFQADLETAYVAIGELQGRAHGCSIPNPEMRGMTVGQLRRLTTYIEEHCEAEGWYDPDSGALLRAQDVDLHCLRQWVLRPATEGSQCSFVELVSSCAKDQKPSWYVSHCAGSVLEFVRCLREHSQRHGLGESATYWVDAYAENPWVEGEAQEVGSLKAMAMAQGTVQVIGSGPVAYLEVGSHSELDIDVEPYTGLRFIS